MKFPVIVTYRQAKATIYGLKTPDGRAKKFPCYRLADRIDGKRHVQNLKTFAEAKDAALKPCPCLSATSRGHVRPSPSLGLAVRE